MYGFRYNFILFLIKLYNNFLKVISCFILNKQKRRKFRIKYLIEKKGYSTAPRLKRPPAGNWNGSKYDTIVYYPYYSQVPDKCEHRIYNENGEPLHTFFLRGNLSYHDTQSRYFIFDRWNYNLDVHFYFHEAVIETMGNPKKKYAMFHEPYSVAPAGYEIFKKNKGIEKDFDLIFTHHTEFLEKYENARFFNAFARIWGVLKDENGNLPENWLEYKTKNVSLVSSAAELSSLHRLRKQLAFYCKRNNLLDTFGNFDGGKTCKFSDALINYRYSIVMENHIDDYWFTEKILNCFAHMVVPIYIGARKIDTLFNSEGIIKVTEKDLENIEEVLKQCTEENYLARVNALKENYYKSLKYDYTLDMLYKNYLEDDLNKAGIKYNFINYRWNENG